jgi:hypothetical protein
MTVERSAAVIHLALWEQPASTFEVALSNSKVVWRHEALTFHLLPGWMDSISARGYQAPLIAAPYCRFPEDIFQLLASSCTWWRGECDTGHSGLILRMDQEPMCGEDAVVLLLLASR